MLPGNGVPREKKKLPVQHMLDWQLRFLSASAALGVDFLFDDELVFDLADEVLQRVDATRTDVSADEHIHNRFAHFEHALVEPHLDVVNAVPGERFGNGSFDASGVVREVDLCDGRHLLALAYLRFSGRTDDAVVREEHAALVSVFAGLRFSEPLVY